MKPPMTVKGCRMVNFLSSFYLELQKLLKPIYRKGRQCIWGEEQQQACNEIKRMPMGLNI